MHFLIIKVDKDTKNKKQKITKEKEHERKQVVIHKEGRRGGREGRRKEGRERERGRKEGINEAYGSRG